jgi:fatty acid synthase, animal type
MFAQASVADQPRLELVEFLFRDKVCDNRKKFVKMGTNENGHHIGVVVSGISGRFPKSNNMSEFSHNLYNKIDMVDDEEIRWKNYHPEVPKRNGKINNLEKFDASFFSFHNRLANVTDPQSRILVEHSYEAILDAGISPQSIIGSRTGVFIGCYMSDARNQMCFQRQVIDSNSILG